MSTSQPTPVRGRFAPSPSGRMHLGNLCCALLAWLSVRSQNGEMLLRIEDLDPDRCTREKAEGRDGLEFIEQRGPEAEIARDAAERICTDIDFHVNFPNHNKFVKNKFTYQVKSYHIHK